MVADSQSANQSGIITRIALKNFVTYDEVVVKPGRNLNLIIGANGTGKSTIVSAIVLGLGGSPKVIGRAAHIGEYVKAGHTNATIEIDLLHRQNKTVTVKREFNNTNQTIWYVNNRQANGKQISDLMKEFSIQVDNLCQFLPQDKVQEFSNLSPQDLLVETERSVGDPKLLEYHNQLKELRTKQLALQETLANTSRLLSKEKQTVELLKDKVGHIQEQKSIEKKLIKLKQKKAWVVYSDRRADLDKAKVERDEAKKTKEKLEKKIKPIENEISKLRKAIQNAETLAKQKNTDTTNKLRGLNNLQGEIEKFEEKIDKEERDCQDKIRDEQDTDQKIAGIIEQKSKLENDLAHKINEVGSVEAIDTELASIMGTLSNHRATVQTLKSEQNFLYEKNNHCMRQIGGAQQKLEELRNIDAERMNRLKHISTDAYNGIMWLRANKHLFSKKVHEPMMLSINIKDPKYAKYFESMIPERDLLAFVCEDKNDMNVLLKHLRTQQRLRINAVHSDPEDEVDDRTPIPIEHIRQYGFEHYMISLITAPKPILNYLIRFYRLNEIPIGNDGIIPHLQNIPDQLRTFFSSKKRYNIRYSEYTKAKSTSESVVVARDYLSCFEDTEKIEKTQNEIARLQQEQVSYQQQMESFNEKIAQAEEKANSHKKIRAKLEQDKGKISDLRRKINANEQKLREIQNARKNVEEIRAESRAEIQRLILQQLRVYENFNRILDDYYKSVIVNEELKLDVKLQKYQLAVKENDSREAREEYENAERNFRNLDNEMRPLRDEVANLYQEASKLTDGVAVNSPEFERYQAAFAKLPASVEELVEEIQKTQAKAFNVNDRNEAQRILNQFNTAKKNLEKCDHDVGVTQSAIVKLQEEITRLDNEWKPMLNTLVDRINNNFSNCFTKMKCAGEVTLIDGGNQYDYAKYGLRIKVKFRDADELQALSRNHQSGGERAVTTAAYMISLQELTRVPFRCVDEINQGMDAANERRVFELIVDITSMANSAQYFLLTPKLLPDLKYHESMTVLTVFNGKYMAPCANFDIHDNIDRICDVVKRRQHAER